MTVLRKAYWRLIFRVAIYALGESSYWHDIALQRLADLEGRS